MGGITQGIEATSMAPAMAVTTNRERNMLAPDE